MVFPTVAAVESEVKANLAAAAPSFAWSVCCGLSIRDRSELFQVRLAPWSGLYALQIC